MLFRSMRTPLSKQRNKHIQRVLVEAAKLAPRQDHDLALVYEREKQKGNANRATLAVASEDGGVSARRRSGATRLRTVRRSPERSGLETAARRKNNRITQRADCQVLQLPTERR